MRMSDLKQRLYKQELAKIGFPNAKYMPAIRKIKIEPSNDGMPEINNNGDIHYFPEHDQLAKDKIRPLVDRVNEMASAWENSRPVPFEGLPRFNILTEYNDIVLAARDDTEQGRGLHFVVWKYDADREGFSAGHYTDCFADAKETFALRAGLIPKEKVVTKEVVGDICAAIEEYVLHCADVYMVFEREERLNEFNDGIYGVYPDIFEGRTPARYEYPEDKLEEDWDEPEQEAEPQETGQEQDKPESLDKEQLPKEKTEKEPADKPAKKPTFQEKLDTAKQKAAQANANKTWQGAKTKKPDGRE